MEDTDLINDALASDTAFNRLVEKYYTPMRIVARAIIGETLADDVVQDAWLSIYQSLPQFEQRSSFKTWAITITANKAKGRLRKESRSISLEQISHPDKSMNNRFSDDGHWSKLPATWDEESPDALISRQELMDCIQHTMAQLNEQQRAALALKDQEGLSLNDICNILDVSASNVRVLIHRARNRLFQHIDNFQETGQC